MTEPRKLRVFLCHASQDKPIVRELYQRLAFESWIDPWLDEEKLLPGQDWDLEIEKAVEITDAVIVCLSTNSVTREGYVQKEIKKVLDVADEKTEDAVFVIPLRLDDCQVPRRLTKWQFEDYFSLERKDIAYKRLLSSLNLRRQRIGVEDGSSKTILSAPSTFSDISQNSVVVPDNITKLILGSWDVRNLDGELQFILSVYSNGKFSLDIVPTVEERRNSWALNLLVSARYSGIYTILPGGSNRMTSITLTFLDEPKLVVGGFIKFSPEASSLSGAKEKYDLSIVNKNLIKSSSEDRRPNELIWIRK